MTTVAEFLAEHLAQAGHADVFPVTGGALFLSDALCHEPGPRPVCFHHEQAAAIGAEAYARIAGHPPVLNVTTGPGGINALNGVFGAWTDSVPMIVVSGQVKKATCPATTPVPGQRQAGDQEGEIIPMVRGITKYAAVTNHAEDIAWHLDQALHVATSGRPGPVGLDIPIDMQSAAVDSAALRRRTPSASAPTPMEAEVASVVARLRAAARPVILAGSGIRAARACKIQVDINPAELGKPTVTPDIGFTAHLKPFLAALDQKLGAWKTAPGHREWLAWCKLRLARYPNVQPHQREFKGKINPYHFVEALFDRFDSDRLERMAARVMV